MADRRTTAIRELLRAERPAIGVNDFASAVARRVRTAWPTTAQGGHLLNVYDGWLAANAEALEVEPADARVTPALVRRFELGLRAPDALRVAIRHRLDCPCSLSMNGKRWRRSGPA